MFTWLITNVASVFRKSIKQMSVELTSIHLWVSPLVQSTSLTSAVFVKLRKSFSEDRNLKTPSPPPLPCQCRSDAGWTPEQLQTQRQSENRPQADKIKTSRHLTQLNLHKTSCRWAKGGLINRHGCVSGAAYPAVHQRPNQRPWQWRSGYWIKESPTDQ